MLILTWFIAEKEVSKMPDLGAPELLVILVIVIILFGPSRLAGVGAAVGQAIREFRQGLESRDAPDGEAIPQKPSNNDVS